MNLSISLSLATTGEDLNTTTSFASWMAQLEMVVTKGGGMQWVLLGTLHRATEAGALLMGFKVTRSIGHKQTISDLARLDIAN